ncbi:MAG TPA: hypothetical protein VES42_10250 [Pilimelia sp.]|nr:hypothetical protein [Pilimelia sp.]
MANGHSTDPAMAHAARVARAHADATDRLAGYLEGLSGPADPAGIAEYANLLARERSTLAQRTEAMRAAGMSVPSMDAITA